MKDKYISLFSNSISTAVIIIYLFYFQRAERREEKVKKTI